MNITVYDGNAQYDLPFNAGETILTVLQKGGVQNISAPCGGKGVCGKCEVYVRSDAFTGTCLACTTEAKNGMLVETAPEVRISIAEDSSVSLCPPTPGQSGYAAACDIGTTTVVCQLLDLRSGKVVSTIGGSNSECIYGGNVLALLEAAKDGHAEEIHTLIIRQVNYYIRHLCEENKIEMSSFRLLSVTGNTIMMHFFAGLNPAELGTAPFAPVSLFGEMRDSRSLGLAFDGLVFLCPSASGFIGSDDICGLLASGMGDAEKPEMLLDLGTNTEIILGNKDGFLACAVDGGAVFKASLLEHGMTASKGAVSAVYDEDGKFSLDVLGGGRPQGICGSGFIDALGIMYENEVIDEMGHIADPEDVDEVMAGHIGEENGRAVFYLTDDHKIYISEADISKFQLAKAAVYAGIQVLAKEQGIGIKDIDRLYLSGGFGTFAHRRNSALLGIIPTECKGKTTKVGNTALAGAASAALSEDARRKLIGIRDKIRVIDLPTNRNFNDFYVDGMLF